MALTNAYTTLNAVKAALRISDAVDDTLIEMSIDAASRAIDGYCQRQFYNAGTAVRYFASADELVCQIDDLAGTAITLETSSVNVNEYDITWEPSDYQLEPLNGVQAGQVWPYTRIRARENFLFPVENELALVKVTGVWGWPAIPKAIEFACILQSQRFFKRFDSPTGVIGFGDMGAIRVARNLDPDIAQSIDQYRKDGYGVA